MQHTYRLGAKQNGQGTAENFSTLLHSNGCCQTHWHLPQLLSHKFILIYWENSIWHRLKLKHCLLILFLLNAHWEKMRTWNFRQICMTQPNHFKVILCSSLLHSKTFSLHTSLAWCWSSRSLTLEKWTGKSDSLSENLKFRPPWIDDWNLSSLCRSLHGFQT